MSDQIFIEMADAWDVQAATQADLHPKERETLRMCADGLRMLVSTRPPHPNELTPEAFDRAPKHRYWGAGEPDCPREIKAGNGELHTLRCKVCGLDSPRNPICRAARDAQSKDQGNG